MARSDLKPCPFCDAKNVLDVVALTDGDVIDGYAVRCFSCRAHGPERDTRVEAMTAWGFQVVSSCTGGANEANV